jgi:hypothetical protein
MIFPLTSRTRSIGAVVFQDQAHDTQPDFIVDLCRNVVALLYPRLIVRVRKFGKLTPLKLLPVSKRDCLVS